MATAVMEVESVRTLVEPAPTTSSQIIGRVNSEDCPCSRCLLIFSFASFYCFSVVHLFFSFIHLLFLLFFFSVLFSSFLVFLRFWFLFCSYSLCFLPLLPLLVALFSMPRLSCFLQLASDDLEQGLVSSRFLALSFSVFRSFMFLRCMLFLCDSVG